MALHHRVFARYLEAVKLNLDEPWAPAVKDLSKLNTLLVKHEKKPSAETLVALREGLAKTRSLQLWVALCCEETQGERALTLINECVTGTGDVEELKGVLKTLVGSAAPAIFDYQGLRVMNSEHVQDKLVLDTLGAVDYMLALFKRRGCPDLLHKGIKAIKLIPSNPFGNTGGSFNVNTQVITLATSKGKTNPRVFIKWVHHSFLHEFGHYLHTIYMPSEAVAAWDEPWDAGNKQPSVSVYGGKDKFEDFAETFVAFMASPEHLTPEADMRMRRALSLSGLYGRPVVRLGHRG